MRAGECSLPGFHLVEPFASFSSRELSLLVQPIEEGYEAKVLFRLL